ncbi:MAG: DNA mismatch repair protein MutS [Candidatus Brocadiia bacterium]
MSSERNAQPSLLSTPMMSQYTRIKAHFPDTILFFRIGDFYEMFGEDAITASKLLGIVLTSRGKGPDAVPLAGVPYHAADTYLARLVKGGFKVAICEQLEDPALAKGVVKRDVVRVITPGTVYDENIVPADDNIYLAAVASSGDACAIAYSDVSTGEFAVDVIAPDRLLPEINRLSPREVLVPEVDGGMGEILKREYCRFAEASLEVLPGSEFDPASGIEKLREVFPNLPEDIEQKRWLPAALALLSYLNRTQRGNLGQFRFIRDNALSGTLAVDSRSLRNLEIVSSPSGKRSATLLGVCDFTSTGMGARMLRSWLVQPLTSIERIKARQAIVRAMIEEPLLRGTIATTLKTVCDVERATARAAASRATPRDIVATRESLESAERIKTILLSSHGVLGVLATTMDELPQLRQEIASTVVDNPPHAIGEGDFARQGVDKELDELRAVRRGGRNWIAEYQRRESQRTGISSLKVGYNSVFGYYIEISKPNLKLVPDDYIRKQTLANAERFITPELKEYETRVLTAEDRILEIERRIFQKMQDSIACHADQLFSLARLLAALDAHCSLARFAEERRCCIPEITDSIEIDIRDGRHPVVDANLPTGTFVPNDTLLNPSSLIHIITGPNMAGKSTYIRQVAQIVILAQAGAPVPAAAARIGIVDRLFTRIGAGDDLARGRSTFMVEMLETAEILASATPRSLIVLDEIGRGTSTFDGISLAWAITEHIAENKAISARTLFATHYHELTELASIKPRVRNFNVAVKEWQGRVVFLHRIEPGACDRSHGIYVSRLAGMPEAVVKRASEILKSLEQQALDVDGKPKLKVFQKGRRQKEVQLLLFDSPYADLLNELRSLKLNSMTPISALEYLQRIQEELKK